jgi:hypothetical protein
MASGLALAQAPRVGLVEFYGVRKVSPERVLNALGVRQGDPLPASKAEAEERVQKVPGVVLARVDAECCAGDGAVLYVEIEEREAQHVEFRPEPDGQASLPQVLTDVFGDFTRYFGEGARFGDPAGPAAEAYRETFGHLAASNRESLREVLRESNDPEQRAIAAYILSRAPVTQSVVDDLQYAMRDSDQTVRANAMRSLEWIAAHPASDPEMAVKVQPTWFVELLNSLVWEDRHSAATALAVLTATRDRDLLERIRERALTSLVEMARWKTPEHARAPFVLVGRIAGLAEKDIDDAWNRGDREAAIQKAWKLKPGR